MKHKRMIVGFVMILAAVSAAAILVGCSDGDDAATTAPAKGTIVIERIPAALSDASWSLTGPRDAAGFGDTIMFDVPSGSYSLTWGLVEGYIKPPGVTETLVAGDTIRFGGAYVANPGPLGKFVLIPAGSFEMGSSQFEAYRDIDEVQHTVTLTRSFYMSTTEVTNRQFAQLAQWAFDNGFCKATSAGLRDALDGSTELLMDLRGRTCEISFDAGAFVVEEGKEDYPAGHITWYGAARYCDWLSLRAGLRRAFRHAGDWACNNGDPYGAAGYRLPTEAEWEYACRAGSKTPFNTGSCLHAATQANFDGTNPYPGCERGPRSAGKVPVGSYPANAFGLYDMHGNVFEWCNDWYGVYGGDATNPVGPVTGETRVARGGHWFTDAGICRSAKRPKYYFPNRCPVTAGLRPVRSAD